MLGFGGLLAIAFIVLKLTEVIDWSWLWVLSPLWAGFAIVLIVWLIGIVGIWLRVALKGLFSKD